MCELYIRYGLISINIYYLLICSNPGSLGDRRPREKTALASTMQRWRDRFSEGKNMALSEEEKGGNPAASSLLNAPADFTDKRRRAAGGAKPTAGACAPSRTATGPASSTFSRDLLPAPRVDCGGGRRPGRLRPRVLCCTTVSERRQSPVWRPCFAGCDRWTSGAGPCGHPRALRRPPHGDPGAA